ncbi:hypothetical protein B566_EDAN000812 [Ephemera danica]|nr:hypothetical protein B566_EDAN000812 [Ephemera danica]
MGRSFTPPGSLQERPSCLLTAQRARCLSGDGMDHGVNGSCKASAHSLRCSSGNGALGRALRRSRTLASPVWEITLSLMTASPSRINCCIRAKGAWCTSQDPCSAAPTLAPYLSNNIRATGRSITQARCAGRASWYAGMGTSIIRDSTPNTGYTKRLWTAWLRKKSKALKLSSSSLKSACHPDKILVTRGPRMAAITKRSKVRSQECLMQPDNADMQFRLEPRGPVVMKGRSEPMQADSQ